MAHYVTGAQRICLKVAEATLLSSEELEACSEYVTEPPKGLPYYWYLRTPYENGLIGIVEGTQETEPTEPVFEDNPLDFPDGTGLRPVLKLAPDSEKPAPGDTVRIGAYTFVAISADMHNERMIFQTRTNYFYGISNP